MKSAMTTTEPPVICASVYDNAPVYMLSTIHTCAEIMTIFKPRWDAETKKVVRKALRILGVRTCARVCLRVCRGGVLRLTRAVARLWQLIHMYNQGMDWVDVRDQLSNAYNFDGNFWRDKKWWVPIFKEIFKSACDSGYVCYKRVCEIAEDARSNAQARALAAAKAKAAKEAGEKGLVGLALVSHVAAALGAVPRTKATKAMTHLLFMEKIAEGLVIEAYNSTKSAEIDHISLSAYDLPRLERAISEMRGHAPPTQGARGAAQAATPGAQRPPTRPTTPASRAGTPDPASGGSATKRKLVSSRIL